MSTRLPAAVLCLVACIAIIGSVNAASRPSPRDPGWPNRFGIDVTDPAFADLHIALTLLEASEADLEVIAGLASIPGNEEFINPFGFPGPVARPDEIDPILTTTVGLHFDNIAELAAPGAPLAAGEGPLGTVVYGQGLVAPTGTEWYLYAKTFAAPCGPKNANQEFGIVGVDRTPLNGGNPAPMTTGSTDNLFFGINTAYVVHAEPNQPYVARRYQRDAAGTDPDFILTDSDWIAICFGNTIIGLIPEFEWDGFSDLRFFGYWIPMTDNGNAIGDESAQMRFPRIEDDAIPVQDGVEEVELGEEAPTQPPTQAPTEPPVATPQPTATTASVATPATATAGPTPAASPAGPTTPVVGGGVDPLVLLGLAGLGLIALAIALWLLSRRDDCDELGRLAKAAQDACARARQAAEEARARHVKAAADARAVEAYERAARSNLADAEARFAKAKARAEQKSESYVEGEPYGRLTADDLALQNEANAEAQAEADAAKAAATAAWKDAGSPQGEGAAKLDDQLSQIGKAAQAKMKYNNDPANIGELRNRAAERAAAELGKLQAEMDAARKSLEDATASLRTAHETESATNAAWHAAEAEAERICNEAAAAQKAYDDCVKKKSANAGQVKTAGGGPGTGGPGTGGPGTGGTGTGTGTGPGSGGVGVGGPGTTGPGTGGTSVGNPPARPCSDGEETWEPIGPARSFTIRADGAKTRVILWTDPAIKDMEEWIKNSASAGGLPWGDHHPSITAPEVDFIPGQLGKWLGGLGGSKGLAAPNMTLHFEIQVKQRTVQCERRWVCRNGSWQPAEARANVTDAPLPPEKLNEGPVTPSIQKVGGFITRAKARIDALKRNEEQAAEAARCQ